MHALLDLDKALFTLINGSGANPYFDWLMPWLRNPSLWMPLYLFLILFLFINFKKEGVWLLVLAILTVALTDSISSHIFKPFFNRLRPCNEPSLQGTVHFLLSYRPGNGSFTSSHASNHFGLAFFLFFTIRKFLGQWMYLFFLWAFSICYAQVYVGVHYPLDVMGGAALGAFIAFLTATIFKNKALRQWLGLEETLKFGSI